MDAGCGITGPLWAERNVIHHFGFYSPYSRTTVGELTYPTSMNEYMDSRTHIGNKQMLSSGCVGIRVEDDKAATVIAQWNIESKVLDVLAPDGSNRQNHRQDQSVLSLVYYAHHNEVPMGARRRYNILFHLIRWD